MESRSPTTSSEPATRDRLAPHFAAWRASGRRVLIPYITAGYPSPEATAELLDALVAAGADLIELGIPFSDPIADGPTIQRSSQRALDQGVDLGWVLERLREFRARHDTPVVLFTYLNPVVCYGTERFLAEAAAAGANGVLLTDLPVGSDPALEQLFEDSPLALVRLLAPTTPAYRVRSIAERAQGFLYYISRMGVTGARSELPPELAADVAAIQAMSPVPVAVGFGISTPEQAAAVARVAEGVVVGSAVINALDRGGVAAAAEFVASLRAAMDAVKG
ncbi:MAG TPA: tryptophan synthase subunit alpha [Longimicrobiales bacterium]